MTKDLKSGNKQLGERKMTDRAALMKMLEEGCRELGLELDSYQSGQCLEYLEMVLAWNEKINLTAIVEKEEFIIKHFLDSLSGAFLMEKAGRLGDIGSGAGFPGLVLKILYPALEVWLIESVRKKAAFLEKAAGDLGLERVRVIHGRAEDLGQDPSLRETFDFAVSRAVSQMAVIAEYCLPLVRIGGCFVAYKGTGVEEEISRSENAVRILGGEIEGVHRLTLPFSGDGRTLISVRKTRPSPGKYPRRAGIPAKRPLL